MTPTNDKVLLQDCERCWFVPFQESSLLEAEDGYTRVHFCDQHIMLNRSLNQIEVKLDPTVYFRANRAQLMNLKAVCEIHPWLKRRLLAKLENGREVTLSRRRTASFRESVGL